MTITIINYLDLLPDILHEKFLEMVNRNSKHLPIIYENNTLFYEPAGW